MKVFLKDAYAEGYTIFVIVAESYEAADARFSEANAAGMNTIPDMSIIISEDILAEIDVTKTGIYKIFVPSTDKPSHR